MQTSRTADPYIGLARVKLARGSLDEAQMLAQQAANMRQDAQTEMLFAEILSARGKRPEAANMLKLVLSRDPQNAYATALLAEQRIRQGYWDDGTDLFVAALGVDTDGDAFNHLRKVTADLVDAVIARKVRPVDALKFVNRVDYTAPKLNAQLGPYLAQARRSLNAGIAIPRDGQVPVPYHDNPNPPPRQDPSAAPPPPRRSGGGPGSGSTSRMQSRTQAPQRRKAPVTNISRRQREFLDSVLEERKLNAALQDALEPLGQPLWPSLNEVKIDPLPAVEVVSSIAARARSQREQVFTLTSGSIFSEIYIERCVLSIMQVIPDLLAGTVTVAPEELAMLEFNARDGLFDDLPEVYTGDLGEMPIADQRKTALGGFLGEALHRAYLIPWSFERDPDRSTLTLADQRFDPFKIAEAWLDEDKRDDVVLQKMGKEALAALPKHDVIALTYEHIDRTAELAGEALGLRLAELYSLYRFALTRIPGTEIAKDLEVLMESEDAIIFSLKEKWLPKLTQAEKTRGQLKGKKKKRYALSYIRSTGEVFLLCSKKGIALTLPHMASGLRGDDQKMVLKMLTDYHAPSGRLIRDDAQAAPLRQQTGEGRISAPKLAERGGQTRLSVWVHEGNIVRQVVVGHAPHDAMAWTVE